MPEEYLRLGDMPSDFQESLMREFVPYTIGMGWVSSKRKDAFTPFGSGTLVTKNGALGVLTARHCVKTMRRVQVGNDTVVLILRDSRAVYLPPDSLLERKLTNPLNDEYGPDLDFIEIAPCEQRQIITAIGSVWSLDRDFEALRQKFATEGTLLASVGFPEERCSTTSLRGGFRRISYHLTCGHVIQNGDITERNGWDYIQSKCFYCDENDLPRSFGGTSGGGIWAIEVLKSKTTEMLSIGTSALVGVSFFQTALEGNTRYVRGHFIRSIYDTAWANKSS